MVNNKKLITTAITYSNGAPHIGHAFEYIMTDVYNRYLRSIGIETYFTTGMDEYGSKIFLAAQDNGSSPQDYVNNISENNKELHRRLNIDYDELTRTTNNIHKERVIEIWNKLTENNAIYKKHYKAKYCVGCEAFKNDSDLIDGLCPDHKSAPKEIDEDNWFFKVTEYKAEIKRQIENDEIKITPHYRKDEILNLIDKSEDISFSRPKDKVGWGIEVPDDNTQIIYVWCDALSSYITNDYIKGFTNQDGFKNVTHIIGKDILRFHAIIWPCLLRAIGFETKGMSIITHGHIISGGQKMSKSLGNTIVPKELLDQLDKVCAKDNQGNSLAGDAMRFVLLHEVPTLGDGDITMEQIKNIYNAHLANGLGNTLSRIMTIVENNKDEFLKYIINKNTHRPDGEKDLSVFIERFDFKYCISEIVKRIEYLNKKIQEDEVFKIIREDKDKALSLLDYQLDYLLWIIMDLRIFMPKTSEYILKIIKENKKPEPLFKRWE